MTITTIPEKAAVWGLRGTRLWWQRENECSCRSESVTYSWSCLDCRVMPAQCHCHQSASHNCPGGTDDVHGSTDHCWQNRANCGAMLPSTSPDSEAEQHNTHQHRHQLVSFTLTLTKQLLQSRRMTCHWRHPLTSGVKVQAGAPSVGLACWARMFCTCC